MKRKKIGEIAVAKNWLNQQELEQLLTLQQEARSQGRKSEETLLGQMLIEQGVCTEAMVKSLLNEQNSSTEFLFQSLETDGNSFLFGSYTIENFIAKGGMGAVYKATNSKGEPVAIKIIRWSNNDDKSKKRFSRENKILAKLTKVHHKNIVKTYEFGQINNVDFLAMDYLDGETLDKVILHRDFTYQQWLEKFLNLLSAIELIHKHNIVHRDLKPSNIMVTKDDEFVLIDFGLGKLLLEENESSLLTTQIMGSLAYMAPEQTIAEGNHDFRTDIWSLGVILYQILTKKLPFRKKRNRRLLYDIQYRKQESIVGLKTNLPWQLDSICNCALQKKKQDRYQSVAEMKTDIKRFLHGGEISAAPQRTSQVFRYRFDYILLGYLLTLISFFPFLVLQIIELDWTSYIVALIGQLFVSLSLGLMFYFKRSYRLILDDRGITEQTKIATRQICLWEDIIQLNTLVNSKRLAIETKMKTWITPKFNLLSPHNLPQMMNTYLKDEQRDLEIIKILLRGGGVAEVAKKFKINSKTAHQITQHTAERLQKVVLKFFNYEEDK